MPKTKRRSTSKGTMRAASTPNRMKAYTYTVLIHPNEPDEKAGFWAEVPALTGCFTRGQTIEECLERAPEAISCHVGALLKAGEPVPEEPRRENVVVSMVRVNLAVPA